MEEATTMVNNCKEWMDATTAQGAALEVGKANSDKMTLHADQDSLYAAMKARWVKVDESAKDWTKKLAELSGMWSKQTEMLNKVTSTMVDGGGQGTGDDEEDEQRHRPRPGPAGQCLDPVSPHTSYFPSISSARDASNGEEFQW